MSGVDVSVWLTAVYAVFLILVAHGFDRLAQVTAHRSDRWRTGGFTYQEDHDAWVCSEDQWLWPMSFDPENRVTRYRAKPTVCNACPVKESCTTSDTGRQMTREVDPWPHSEAGRFHRGIACTICALAVLLPFATLVAERDLPDAGVLIATVVFSVVASLPLVSHFRNTPDGFPENVPVEIQPGRPDIATDVAAKGLQSLIPASRRAVYGSDTKSERRPPKTPAAQPRPDAPRPDRYGTHWGSTKSKEHL